MAAESLNNSASEQCLDDVVVAYLKSLQAGQTPDPEEWLGRYPDLAAELREFFADQAAVRRWTAPLRPLAATPPPAATDTPLPGAPETEGPGPAAPLPSFGDYELMAVIGRGGMGAVFEARQRSLNRRVALKMIRADPAAFPAEGRRFRNEAEMAAGLDQTNIVPVYEVAEHAGQLYFSMKRIEGGSLAEHLDRFAADPKLAARLVAQVARAVHHAHQRGILHRDLKPSNILLDAAGQPHVTDFGLAKRVEIDSSLTQSGALVGTPSYMAPEQASGKKGAITTATDVYGLGAVLYALLTGRPPFRSETVLDTLEQVKNREPEPPSKTNRRVDRDLETICLKCLDKEPGRRYASAETLAEDLERWLAGKPIQARPISRAARVWRWCRRNPMRAGAGALLVAALVLIAGNLWRLQRQAAATERAVGEDLREAEWLQEQERWGEANRVLERAAVRLGEGRPADLRERMERMQRDVALAARLEEARLQNAAAGKGSTYDYDGADRAFAAAFATRGLDVKVLDLDEAAGRIQSSAIRRQLVGALDDWASVKDDLQPGSGQRLLELARRADDDPWRQRLRDATARKDGAALERLAAQQGVLTQQPAAHLEQLGVALWRVGRRGAAVQFLRQAQQRHPADLWINLELACQLWETGAPAEAIGFFRVALAFRPKSPAILSNVGCALAVQGKSQEAVDIFQQAIALNPELPGLYFNLGKAYQDQKKLAEAVDAYREAVARKPDYPEAYYNLGLALQILGRLTEAADAYRKHIAGMPNNPNGPYNLGNALRDQGDLEGAAGAFRQAIVCKPDFAEAHCNLGQTLRRQGRFAEALDELKRGHALGSRNPRWPYPSDQWAREAEQLVQLDTKLARALKGEAQLGDPAECLALAYFCRHHKKRFAAAARFYGDAFAAEPRLAGSQPSAHRYNAACAGSLAGCGQGDDATSLDDKQRARLRQQALDWLRADLAAWHKALDGDRSKAAPAVRRQMQHWLRDADFVGLRGPQALAKLPEPERSAWRKLWAEVEDLFVQAGGKSPGPEK
jgi:serine/threonine-protein kinase